ncbi:MAG: hypothetical protein RLZZ600_818 [Actinomycetota bacterium]|jgi:hypothetical protein
MKYVALILVGVGLGFLVAHQVSRTPSGKAFLDNVDATTRELSNAVREGFLDRSAALREQNN